jgi:hypothetical protein
MRTVCNLFALLFVPALMEETSVQQPRTAEGRFVSRLANSYDAFAVRFIEIF